MINTIIGFFYSLFGSVTIEDWKHYPNYQITLDTDIPTSEIISAYDVQPDVLIYRNDKGAILGYDNGSTQIDVTDWVGHVTLEGTIIIWGEDADTDGVPCIIFPYNTEIDHITADGEDLDITPIPSTSQMLGSTNVRWRYTDRPNYWFTDSPRISITVKYDTTADEMPYVDTTYWAQNTTRYDYKTLMPEYWSYGSELNEIEVSSIKITDGELRSQIDLCAWLIGILKRKYTQETATLDSFRKKTFNE